ncbi:Retrovirus-related Pol polyprotein from transposon RE1 [Vitis vinifera]|uniref:Retrovirus-related Pol polyprotein from transposon RE1 n=1 Tax=Vitis vinifera TaxID=29760 RepID=A0A438FWS5_VITVI|nr:Retrovirus-related Pol polyprotein from transposon RE1 [Vitis vinifera]
MQDDARANGYLDFLYSGKGNVSRMYDVWNAFHCPEKGAKSLTAYFMDIKKVYEELNALMPFSPDVRVQQTQREQMTKCSVEFYELRMSRLLSTTMFLLAKGGNAENARRVNNRGGNRAFVNRGNDSSAIVCFYCHEAGHTKKNCKKLQNRNRRNQIANVATSDTATSSDSSDKIVTMTDLMTKRIFGKGHVSDGLYILDEWYLDQLRVQHLLETACALMFQMKVPKQFWADAVSTTCFLINRMPIVVLKGVKVCYLGVLKTAKGYRCFSTDLNKYLLSTDVVFSEDTSFFSSPTSSASEEEEEEWLVYQVVNSRPTVGQSSMVDSDVSLAHLGTIVDVSPAPVKPPIVQVYSRRPVTTDTCPALAPSSSDPSSDLDLPISLRKASIDSISTPKTVTKALNHPSWKNAMLEEIRALEDNHTWKLVDLPRGKKVVDCKWTYGVDYFDTFSPVAKLNSVRLFISIAASQQWMIHQLDIKNAFLHGDLEEEVHMEQPPGFVAQGDKEIQAFDMNKSKKDHFVFYKKSAVGIILLVVYVDDIVIIGNDHAGIFDLKAFMHSKFHTKDLETGKIEAKPCTTPMVPNVQLMPDDGDLFYNPERYRRVVRKLNYLTVTRPYIAYAVSVVSQFTSVPTVKHWAALEQILCYLKKAPGLGIIYSSQGHTRIECFSNADWAGSKFDRRSTTEYEYRAMAQATCEIIWIHQLLCEVGMKCTMPTKLWCDNQAALHIVANPVYHERTKHIEVDCHFIREKIEENLVSTGYVKIGKQLGDIFTKALDGTRVEYFCNKLGMINIYAPA